MLRRLGVVVLWVLATVGTASITLAAVGQVGERTTGQAARPIDSADLRSSPAVQRLATSTTTTTMSAVVTTEPLDPLSTTDPTTTTTTAPTTATTGTSGTSVNTTTAPPATTTTAASEVVWRHLEGGSIAVRVEGDSVTLVTVQVTDSGWIAEVKDDGPAQVVVELENESKSRESHYQASVEHGELVVQIEEDGGD